ncbi:hypothetical protein LNTAR_08256 [Lentisphaera araneosa HTCC2155]|uniref:DUF2850 domain-containing protein n=1 Tax=Lentisphaera araneosa HTCC2155 TaxID=313628 RepID=A6DS25_9BACT|nr:hypothetical protein [Lentisphaera araneosa]EDM25600.1 hypothetical protein LNTAR_08256 [Lentisphaera araneosa HTCC2155]
MSKRKTIANLPVLPEKKDQRRLTLLGILLVLVVQFSLISWNTQKLEEQSVKYSNENIIGEWVNDGKVFKSFSFHADGTCETANFDLPFEKVNDNEYLLYSFDMRPIYSVKYIDWKNIEVQSKITEKNISTYTRKL